jgi:hypothetical protein
LETPWRNAPRSARTEANSLIPRGGVWNETQAALGTIAEAAESLPAVPAHRHLGLELLMPDFEQRMAALGRNIAKDKIAFVQAVVRRCD